MRVLLYVIALFCFAVPSYHWFATGHFSGFFSIAVGIVLVWLAQRRRRKTFAPEPKFDSGNKEVDELNEELFSKAVDDFNAMQVEMKSLKSGRLRSQLQKMQGIARHFLSYLEEHPERITLARRFIDYYQDRALLLVRKYKELEKTGLEAQEVKQAKDEICQLLESFDEAYEDQFSKVLNAQLLDLDAEMKVMKQNMAADGIETEKPEAKAIPKSSDDVVGTLIDLADKFLNDKRK